MGVTDLNRQAVSMDAPAGVSKGAVHVFRQAHLLTGYGLFADAHISSLRVSVSRRALRKTIPLRRPVFGHGICSTHASGKLARYRGLSASPSKQAVSHGHPFGECGAQHAIQSQRTSRLADLCRLRPGTDPYRPSIVCRRRLGPRTRPHCLRTRWLELCLSVFPWALFRSNKSAVKLHTLLDLRGNIPTFLHIYDGKLHDVDVLDILLPEPGAFYIVDRGYVDFERLFALNMAGAFFVIRAKSNIKYRRRYSHRVDRAGGVRCDQTIVLTGVNSATDYPQTLRRIKYHDVNTGKTFNFLTNNFAIPAQTVADLYRYRWQVELFFKWIKQHLRIKSFFGTSENAVKSQIWIAISVYVLVAIIKKRLDLQPDLYTILQVLSLTLFEKTPLEQILIGCDSIMQDYATTNQLNLFDNLTGQ